MSTVDIDKLMGKRIIAFDCLRAFAISLVLICHLGQSFGVPLFGIAGGVANCIFFILSGLCLGVDWHKHGCIVYDWEFLRKRMVRLYIPFLCFLIPYLLVLWANDVTGWGVMCLNILMFSWFAPLPGAGHLWFVTGMLFQYVLLFCVTRFYFRTKIRGLALALIILIICLSGQVVFVITGIGQGYLLMLLAAGVIFFVFGDWIIRALMKCSNRCMLAFVMAICLLGIVGIVGVRSNQTVYYWLCMMVAVSVSCGFLLSIRTDQCNPIIMFVSSISYEIYLIHYPLCAGSPLFLRKILHNGWVYSATVIIGSLVGGFLLNRLVKILTEDLSAKYMNSLLRQKLAK